MSRLNHPTYVAAAAGLAIGASALAQQAPFPQQEVQFRADSGLMGEVQDPFAGAREPVVLWDQIVTVAGSTWMRIHFGSETLLAGPDRHNGGSYLVITSLEDGAQHFLDATTLPEWDNISAFMNGETVLVQLMGPPGNGSDRVVIERVTAGLPGVGVGVRTICGNSDDRVPYNDQRTGRLSTGCTGWLIAENGASNEWLTAGHCINNGQTGAVMLMNVPASTSGGSLVAPPPAFQFPVQSASIQSTNTGIGNDHARFNTNNNSNTGLPARIAQGRTAYILASSAPTSGTASTTVRGHGTVNNTAGIPSVPNQWQQVNKTHVGPYAGKTGTRIRYETDTTGGNSGSPVTQLIGFPFLLEQAIGIHTNAGCSSSSGSSNSGTAIENAALQAALASPSGTALAYDSAVHRGLFTTAASDNGGSDGGSIFFDVITEGSSIEITNFWLNINRQNTSNNSTSSEDDDFFNFDVYIRPGTADGFETSMAGWTKVAEGGGMPKFEDEYTLGALKNTITLNAAQHYGMAIVFDSGAGHAYTNANGSNETYSNADMSITGISASNTSFGSNINGRVWNGGFGYKLNEAQGKCLETLYASNNNGSNGGMVYFDVVVGSQPVVFSRINTNVEGTGGLDCDLKIYRKNGTHVGFETLPAAWTQVATAEGLSAPIESPSSFQLSNYVNLSANTTYGFAVELTTSGVNSEGHAYTNGNGLNQEYSDSRITIKTGSASNTPFSSPFSPRVWNGSFCYGQSLSICGTNIANQSLPDTSIGGFNSQLGGQEEADDFGSAQNMTLQSVTAWGYYIAAGPAPLNQDFVIRVFNQSGGLPGSLAASRTVNNVALKDTGMISNGGRPVYQFDINFTDINLSPGQYWISVMGDEPGYTWTWNRTDTVAGGHAFRTGTGAWSLSGGNFAYTLCGTQTPVACYPNCDGSTAPPILNVADFGCFLTKFAAGQPYANCDGSTQAPVLNVADFGCFLSKFAAGCL